MSRRLDGYRRNIELNAALLESIYSMDRALPAHRPAAPTYLSGPMTGIPYFNYPLFELVAECMRAEGYAVVNPTENDTREQYHFAMNSPEGLADDARWAKAIGHDIPAIVDCDSLTLLPNWDHSRGAVLECVAGLLTGKKFYRYDTGEKQVYPLKASDVLIGVQRHLVGCL